MQKSKKAVIRCFVAQVVNEAFGRNLIGDEEIEVQKGNLFSFAGDDDKVYHWKVLESERGANMVWLFEKSKKNDGYHELVVGDQVVITIPNMAILRPADDGRLPNMMYASIDTPADVIHYRIPVVMTDAVGTLVQAIAEADRLCNIPT